MRTLIFVLTVIVVSLAAGCAENSGASKPDGSQISAISPTSSVNSIDRDGGTPRVELSFAELLGEMARRPSDQPAFPCDVRTKLGGNAQLEKLRQRWLGAEDDGRYRIATKSRLSGGIKTNLREDAVLGACVCPGICVFVVQDKQGTEPNNYGVLVITDKSPERGVVWAARNIDLSTADLTFRSSTPYFEFAKDGNERVAECGVFWDPQEKRYGCTTFDGKGGKQDQFAKRIDN